MDKKVNGMRRVSHLFGNAEHTLSASLLIAADGVRSTVREQLGIKVVSWGYGQTAIITNITPQQHHQNIAYERFTDTGPLALLPMTEQRCAVVWTVASEQADDILALDDDPTAVLVAFFLKVTKIS